MQNRKERSIVLFLMIAIIAGMLSIAVNADTYASDYISSCSTTLLQGSSTGQLKLNHSIVGKGTMDKIGVIRIQVYKSDGTWDHTIYGTTANGLLELNKFVSTGIYTFSVATGYSYYCKVVFYAEKNGGFDTCTVQTATVAAPVYP